MPANSYIHFTLEGSDSFGSIQTLFSTNQIQTTFAQVALFVDVEQRALESTLTTRFQPPLPTTRKTKDPKTVVICIKDIIGHVAVLSNVSGVFGIDTEQSPWP
ncbi:hypothetical protein KEM48_004446 [Puccinia striiformis f. sp. tritici PST-130]|nr:hypothetical protein KEM48_004446 [Puccinia striiformis f. sp. tritici PST-130]